jgi:ferrochelatase
VILNLGTPDSPTPKGLGEFLSEFLMDPYVMQMPGGVRTLLVRGLIVPFRKAKSAQKYQQVWTESGSPLMVYSKALAARAQVEVGDEARVYLAMRYGKPSLSSVMEELKRDRVTDVRVVPLFPQYAESTFLSAQKEWEKLWQKKGMQGAYTVLGSYFGEKYFVGPMAALAKEFVKGRDVDHWLMTYHSLPESHIKSAEGAPSSCLKSQDCCWVFTPEHSKCYRAQAYHTSVLLAKELGLAVGDWTMTFQSRLGRGRWLRPSTEEVLLKKVERGARTVAILSPSFVTDGLETLEEIGLGLREKFVAAGGKELLLVPCLNDNVDFVSGLMRAALGRS